MNKDKFNLDSLTTEELQGMVKAGKMAEYILSHREVDRAESIREQNIGKIKRSFEVLSDNTVRSVKATFNYDGIDHQVIMWQELSGEFKFYVLQNLKKHQADIESIYKNGYSSLNSDLTFATKLRMLYQETIKDSGDTHHSDIGPIEEFILFASFRHVVSGRS